MKKYEYVSVKIGSKGPKSENYRKIIDEYALKGYKYVGYVPTEFSIFFEGQIKQIDLIFEKEESK